MSATVILPYEFVVIRSETSLCNRRTDDTLSANGQVTVTFAI
jgi:hypothetical protein